MTILLTRLLFLAAVLFLLAEPAAASLKRVVLWERHDGGFPLLIETFQEDRLKLAQITPCDAYRTRTE